MLGFLLFPFIVGRLRRARVVSLPEWLEKTYGDARVRKLAAAAMVLLYTIYLVIQFRAFGVIVSYMLEIPQRLRVDVADLPFRPLHDVRRLSVGRAQRHAESAPYRGRASAPRRGSPLPGGFSLSAAAGDAEVAEAERFAAEGLSLSGALSGTVIMLAWGLGVAGNPQYAIRIIACRSKKESLPPALRSRPT